MLVRQISEEDKPAVAGWFTDRRWPMPAVEGALPKIGLVAETDKGDLVACAYLYTTSSTVAYISWTGTNPDLPQGTGMQGMDLIVEKLKAVCENIEPKISALIQYTSNDKLKTRLQKLGFKSSGEMTQLVWRAR